jgi:SAM-dependent methyltransferase
MGYKSSVKNWEGLAKNDALWSILTDKSKKGDRWNTDDFFKSGKSEVEAVLALLKNEGIEVKRKNTAIDFGCGAGRLTRALYPYFEKVVGIDASETMVLLGRENNSDFSDKLEFKLNQTASLEGFSNASVSFALTLIVLQHIPFPQSLNFIKEMVRVLETDGLCVFQVPVKDVRKLSLWQKFKSTVRIRERLALIGIGSGFQMDMHVIEEGIIESAIQEMKGEIVLKSYTNQTLPDYNGDLQFYKEEHAASGYVSRLFVVRKK